MKRLPRGTLTLLGGLLFTLDTFGPFPSTAAHAWMGGLGVGVGLTLLLAGRFSRRR